jgi:8-oxo-dGTP pyrophosphatase MutT (NUDIX family)
MSEKSQQRPHFMDRIRRMVWSEPTRLQVAALPWRMGAQGVEIMLITSRDTGRWVLPKGWPENDEALWNAAAREAGEEAGISGSVARRRVGIYVYLKGQDDGTSLRCEVQVFPLEIDKVADKWPEKKQRQRKWFSPQEAASSVDEPDLATLIADFAANPRRIAV